MDFFMDTIGLCGSMCFAFGSWPQAWKVFKSKNTEGLSLLFTSLCFLGGVSSSIYAFATQQYMLLPNFTFGAAGLAVTIYCQLKNKAKKC